MELIAANPEAVSGPAFGLPVVSGAVPVSAATLRLARTGIRALWGRIVSAHPGTELRPLLLSYDIHPTPQGPVLIEVNTNAGGALTAIETARRGNACCPTLEAAALRQRLLQLLKRDLVNFAPGEAGVVAIVDDGLATQQLLPEMQAIANLLRPLASRVLVVDALELVYADGRLRHQGLAIDRVYWRSTDFLLADPAHAPVARAVAEGTTLLAPGPAAYSAIADKRHFIEWSADPVLARDAATGLQLRIAETLPLSSRPAAQWYADRQHWVFKPVSGHGSRGVYVGKNISRRKLDELPAEQYLAQRYVPHPVVEREGVAWKYDLRLFADRGELIGAAARVFQGQVVGMRTPGSGFAPVRVERSCCLVGALAAA
jgi:hypothetical protein